MTFEGLFIYIIVILFSYKKINKKKYSSLPQARTQQIECHYGHAKIEDTNFSRFPTHFLFIKKSIPLFYCLFVQFNDKKKY